MRVKYKVRFILKKLLHPSDFVAIVGDADAPRIDVQKARHHLDENLEAIAKRLR